MIPFQKIDPKYLDTLEEHANEVRAAARALKLFIAANEGEDSPAFQWASERHKEWKAVCSLTCKSIREAKGVQHV